MAHQTIASGAASRTTTASERTTRLLACGVAAGPLFLGIWALQAFTRDGYDVQKHPISLLSLGELGWIQIANFVVTGTLFVALALGLRRVWHPGRGGTWAPRLIGAVGGGLIASGVLVTDAGAGFPAGAPAGAPDMSWHGVVHEVGYVVVMLSWTAAGFVMRRRFAAEGERGLGRLCVAAVVAVFIISAWPDLDSLTIRIVIATAVQFGLLAVVARRAMVQTQQTARSCNPRRSCNSCSQFLGGRSRFPGGRPRRGRESPKYGGSPRQESEDGMSFQAYLDAIEDRTGKTPNELVALAAERGYDSSTKSMVIVDWLKEDFGIGRGHAMAVVHVIKNGPTISDKHVGTSGVHRDESNLLRLDGKARRTTS